MQKYLVSGQSREILPSSAEVSLLRGSSQNCHSKAPQRQVLKIIQNNPTHYQNDCEQFSTGSTGSSTSTSQHTNLNFSFVLGQ